MRRRLWPLLAVALLLVYLATQTLTSASSTGEKVAYSELLRTVERSSPDSARRVENVLFVPHRQRVEATLGNGRKLESHYPTEAAQLALQGLLERKGITFDSKGTGSSGWWSFLTYILPFGLMFVFWTYLVRRVKGRTGTPGARLGGLATDVDLQAAIDKLEDVERLLGGLDGEPRAESALAKAEDARKILEGLAAGTAALSGSYRSRSAS